VAVLELLTYQVTQMTIESTKDKLPNTPAITYSECYVQPFFTFYNADNMEIMKHYPDKYFDLAIVDPPYGIDNNKSLSLRGYTGKGCPMNERMRKSSSEWDIRPTKEYFDQLFRISKNVIIWGGNYFTDMIPPSREWVVWNKDKYSFKHSDFEMAYTSYNGVCKIVKIQHHGFLLKDKDIIHPTQKPVVLYEYLIDTYCINGNKIIDTHLGSGSIAIAIDKANVLDKKNLTFVGIELDPDYYRAAVERFKNHKRQCVLF
jgi:site-specific DNA-methyltransferase (adenine-specific)